MADQTNEKNLRRKDLEEKFKDGTIPKEADFKSLINSMINKQDDGFSKDENNGFEIKITKPKSKKFISLYKDLNSPEVFFSIEKDDHGTALILNPLGDDDEADMIGNESIEDSALHKSFYFDTEGKLGIGKMPEDHMKLEVEGFVGMRGRVGTYKIGVAEANGRWQPIIEGLSNCKAFEVVARAGKVNTGKFALLHATALATFGPKKSRIRKSSAHYGWFWN
ncbi:MAG TPA: hypothetical protein VKH37_00245, partial [Ferruginibacter sp.]|nr:hypothetical protein [Ferruginibacter sp.]